MTDDLEEEVTTWAEEEAALAREEPKSICLIACAAEALPELVQRRVIHE